MLQSNTCHLSRYGTAFSSQVGMQIMGSSLDLHKYRSVVFDCDGVILNSNSLKTEAFYLAAKPYGESAATQLVEYHVRHGGVSRYEKFRYFLDSIVKAPVTPELLAGLLDAFAYEVRKGLMHCELAAGLVELRQRLHCATWSVVSGGDQQELRDVFKARKIDSLFDAGIFGSPDRKAVILNREIASGKIQHPAVFFGDSRLDHEAAKEAGLEFCFVSEWTEFQGWRRYQQDHDFMDIEKLDCLL